ncbi:MAG: cytochrome c3 family protein [Desulfurivibrionaceae bacterium]
MMFGKKVILLAASLLLAMSLWACSTDFDARDDQASSAAGASLVGAGNCIGCHGDADLSTDASPQVISDYLAGNHVIHSTHIDADSGDCLECHDPLGDGRSLENLIEPGGPFAPDPPPAEEYIPLAGLAAVTCETCHGGGGNHITDTTGIPVPYVTPDYNRCGQCHNSDFFHNTYHPEADNIVEDYIDSKHLTGTVRNTAVCVKCHTDEGAILYKADDTVETLTNALPVPEANNIQCRTCHDPHNNSLLLEEATESGSAEYNTCTNCHQRHDAQIIDTEGIQQIPGTATPDGSNGELIFHAGSWDRVISSTHWDNPATSYQAALAAAGGVSTNVDQTTVIVEGYAIDPTNPRACRDCHNVHGADATINKQWASSGHGGKIRVAKETAAAETYASTIEQIAEVRAAGANGADSSLPHYDWDKTYKADGVADRGPCQRCHTATGAKNFLNAMITLNDADPDNDIIYDPVNNDFSHLVGWAPHTSSTATVSSGQNELIYCWACHSDNSGNLRDPGALTVSYSNNASATFPDSRGANVCLACHTGRENGDSIKNSTEDFSATGFINSHYLTAGGTLFATSGYEYEGRDYELTAGDLHQNLGYGTAKATGAPTYDDDAVRGSYTNGPCVTCHFGSNDGSHSLSPFTEYAPGDLALNPVCVNCHGKRGAGTNAAHSWLGTDFTVDNLVAGETAPHKGRYLAALEALRVLLAANGYNYTPDYPYFDNQDWTIGISANGKDNMGAAFNFNLLVHDPAGVAHNRRYTRRLIYDSIDLLDNGAMDYSVSATLNALDPATTYQTSAISYLIADGTAGTAAERY